VSAIGCRIAAPETKDIVHSTLNQAWVEFWHDPQGYAAWEKNIVITLGEQCAADSA
jgi:hypothetical protein